MARPEASIRIRLITTIAAFISMLLTLGAISIGGLLSIDKRTEAIDRKWLVATRILGELDYQVSALRISDAYRASNPDTRRADVDPSAQPRRRGIEELLDQYASLVWSDRRATDLEATRRTIDAYLDAHDAQANAAPGAGAELPDSVLHQLYLAADDAVDRLVDANKERSRAEAATAEWVVDATIMTVLAFTGAAIVLGAWLMRMARRRVIQPLTTMTAALTRLAEGDRDVEVSGVGRQDEIGALARACDAFRATVVALEDAHEATRTAQEQAQAQARHDPLTGLPNRRVFFAELETAVARSKDGHGACSVLLIDLDRFKAVNDLQGHGVGDTVLSEVARRITSIVRRSDTVARLGGDEFAIITESRPGHNSDAVIRLASRLIAAVGEPIVLEDDFAVEIGASIGIASCSCGGMDATALLRAADIAMYRAKRDGSGMFRFFEQSMDDELRAQMKFEADLRKAVAAHEIMPHYQPLIEMSTNGVYGFEILARWQHPDRGAVPPSQFIPIAERLGLVSELTWSILRRACRDAALWPTADIRLSLNISPTQLKDPRLADDLLAILAEEDFSPERLEIEMTETALVRDLATARAVITALQNAGIQVSLDDFGTGYSSLYHLRELKFDKVKIDSSFVTSLQGNNESEKIIDAILSLAKSLGLPTVAEGIENPSVLRHLASRGCEYGQGFYFGKAMAAADVERVLNENLSLVLS